MRYFSLQELITALPTAFGIGVLFALLYAMAHSVLCALTDIFDLSGGSFKLSSKAGVSLKADASSSKILKMTKFVLSELLNFLLIPVFAVVFSVCLYIICDGIPRGYICIVTLTSFFATLKFCKRPIELVCGLLSSLLCVSLKMLIFIAAYIPKKVHKSRKRGKNR